MINGASASGSPMAMRSMSKSRTITDMENDMVKNGLPPVHPGQFLREALDELDLSQAGFAEAIGVSPMRVSLVIKGARPVTAELALLFGRAFGQTPQYWLNLQADYDLKAVEKAMVKRLRHVTALVPA